MRANADMNWGENSWNWKAHALYPLGRREFIGKDKTIDARSRIKGVLSLVERNMFL